MPRSKSSASTRVAPKKSSVGLDGLVADLYKKVYVPLDPTQKHDHLEGLRFLHRQISQIQKLEKYLIPNEKVLSGKERVETLSQWINSNGVEVDGIEFVPGLEQGCGVIAKKRFEEGELITTVPNTLMMTTYTAMDAKEDVGLLCENDQWLRQVPSLILAMHLLFEKHKAEPSPSRWKGFIQSLPGQHCLQETNMGGPEDIIMPIAFSMNTIEALKGTLVLEELHKMMRSVVKQYCHIYLLLQRLKQLSPSLTRSSSWFSFAQFRWAVSMVMMRQNQIPGPVGMEASNPQQPSSSSSSPSCMALIPILDMFNHEEGPITSYYDINTKRMEITAKRSFEPGEQVYISYGSRPNVMLLLYSGFVSQNNPRDRIRLMLDLPPSDPLYSKKLALLKWLELPPTVQLDLFSNGTPSRELQTWIKVTGLEDQDLLTKALRSVIAIRAEETAQLLQAKADVTPSTQPVTSESSTDASAADITNGDASQLHLFAVQTLAENLKKGNDSAGESEEQTKSDESGQAKILKLPEEEGMKKLIEDPFSAVHWKKLLSVCESKLKEMGCSFAFPNGKESKDVVFTDKLSLPKEKSGSREINLALKVRAMEIQTLKNAILLAVQELHKLSYE